MIYKGSTIVRPYKSLGSCNIKDPTGAATLEVIPWYSEQKVYKGSELIYPCLIDSNKHFTATDSFISFFAQGNPSNVNLGDPSTFKYGSFRFNNTTRAGSCTDISMVQDGSVLVFNLNSTQTAPALKSLTNAYSKLEPDPAPPDYKLVELMGLGKIQTVDSSNSLTICNYLCRDYYSAPAVRLDFGAVFLTSKTPITGISARFLYAEQTSSTGEPALNAFNNLGSLTSGTKLASFTYTELWHVHCNALLELSSSGHTFIKPLVQLSYDSGSDNAWHAQAVNMRLCAHLEKYY